MPSNRRIQVESPRQGIIKSSKNIEEVKPKEQKHIKYDIIESKKTISIEDQNDVVSLDNHENATQKAEQVFTVKSMAEPQKKGCLKNADGTGLSLKKICIGEDAGEMGSCKSIRSTKSIKFNKKANVYVYKKDGQKKSKEKKLQSLKKARMDECPQVGTSQEDQCCVIF